MSDWNASDKPKYCCWVLNYRCMFRCKMCYIWQTDQPDEETSLDAKKKFIDSLSGFVNDDFEFHLSGGEPLLEPHILDIIRHIHSRGFKSNLVTNGWLADEKMLRGLSDSGLQSLTFSLDGISPETHDHLRGKDGSFARIMNAIDTVKTRNIDLRPSVIMLVNEVNIDEVLPLTDWVESRSDIEMISFQVITQPFSRPKDDAWFRESEDAFLWPKDVSKTGRVLNELHERRKAGGKIGNHPNQFLAFQRYFENPNRFLKKIKCTMGDYEFHVDPFGKIFFCCFTDPIGNIKEETVPDLWNAPHTRKIRNDVYNCKQNCHIMINCFFEDEKCDLRKPSLLERVRDRLFVKR